jgi:predicted outer membrane repeat protein
MKIKNLGLLLLLLFSVYNTTAQTIRYVKSVSTGTGDGSSWANASSDLQGMINSSLAYDEIWVAAGTYNPTLDPSGNASPADPRDKTFHLKDSVKLYGGFIGTETQLTQRDFTLNTSRLSGDFNNDDVVTGNGSTLDFLGIGENAYHVVISARDSSITLLDGFTISGGYAINSTTPTLVVEGISTGRNDGGGINLNSSSATITNCKLEKNFAQNGGGINANISMSHISFTSFSQNNSTNSGGGLRIINANTTVTNCSFSGNQSGRGGGLTIAVCSARLTNCTFYLNHAVTEGGGINVNSGSSTAPRIYNCIFNQNSCTTYGSAICSTSLGNIQAQIYNCTVTKNTAGGNGGSITANGPSGTNSPKIRNCVIWGNLGVGSQGIIKITTATPEVSNTIVQGGFGGAGTCINCPGTNGNIDPLFKNISNINGADNLLGTSDDGIFLTSTSPAINVGDATVLSPLTDITNFSRTGTFDLGAYEYRCLETSSITDLTICSNDLPLNWNGFVYSTAGTYIDTIPNLEGCDSILTLNLSVNNISTSNFDTIICAANLPYIWHGLTFSASGTQTITLTNALNCDSIVSYNLVVYDGNSTSNETICSSQLPFYWNGLTFNAAGSQTATLLSYLGCDSLATLNLTVLNSSSSTTNLTVCSYDMPYTWNNIVFPGPGTQTASFTNSVGCDSIATINLSVIDPTYLSITAFDETLIADENNATYQWISCDSTTNGNIPGETNQSFTATANGNYAVIVTTTSCSDTSGCFNIATVGIKTQERAVNKIVISPNPNNGTFTIDLKEENKLIITDALGRKVYEKTLQLGKQKIDLQNENSGVYLITLISNNQSQTGKLILNK